VEETIATVLEIMGFTRVLQFVIIKCVCDGQTPRAVTVISPPYLPAVIVGVSSTQVMMQAMLARVVVDV
jgi:hypothetical protein